MFLQPSFHTVLPVCLLTFTLSLRSFHPPTHPAMRCEESFPSWLSSRVSITCHANPSFLPSKLLSPSLLPVAFTPQLELSISEYRPSWYLSFSPSPHLLSYPIISLFFILVNSSHFPCCVFINLIILIPLRFFSVFFPTEMHNSSPPKHTHTLQINPHPPLLPPSPPSCPPFTHLPLISASLSLSFPSAPH